MRFPYAEIEKKLGYEFKDKKLLEEAFTHSSYGRAFDRKDNERMEYLGDAVLQIVVSDWLYKEDENATAGRMTERRQLLVCQEALDSAVDGLGIWEYLIYAGKAENIHGKAKSSLFEAVTAAIYLDGGFAAAERFVLGHGNLYTERELNVVNAKGELQEFLQKRGESLPCYRVERSGPDHAPVFRCEATAMGASAKGEGKTRREAEQTAAARLLWELTPMTAKPLQ